MALPWIRLDTSLPDHPKFLALVDSHKDGRATAFVYVCGLAYSGKHETAGFIPKEALTRCNGRRADAERLCETGLWTAVMGGWQVNGWADFQLATPEQEERSLRARRAAEARWGNRPDATQRNGSTRPRATRAAGASIPE